jgi:putative hydrolase of the HAD superfamily
MNFKNKKHIFFDLDHTLWDFDKNSSLTFKKLFSLHDINVNLKSFLKVYEPINLKYWKLYREEKIDKVNLRYFRLKDTFDALEIEISDRLINDLSDEYIKFLSTFNHLIMGSLDILKYLHPKYKLHIITNGFQEVQRGKLEKSGISFFFDTVTNSEMVGVKKPNRKIFDYALSAANTDTESSLMIGDNLEADILGAKNIGIDTIFFNYHNVILPRILLQLIILRISNYTFKLISINSYNKMFQYEIK